jgi:cephalosporin hydroxylase
VSRYLENNLDMPIGQLVPLMQAAILGQTTYFGIATLKCPLDAWIYQEIIFETQPDVIVEIGTGRGGTTLYLAHLCTLMGKGRVISIDVAPRDIPANVALYPRITLLAGDAGQSFQRVKELIGADERVMVIEDSAHTYANTLDVLRLYSGLVRPGDYFIVEDSNCHHGLETGPMPGPWEAIETFLRENPDFAADRSRERFVVTWNPRGYLRRKM